jgi:Nitroreductase family
LTEELNKENITAIITKVAYPISKIISRRWSTRAFSIKPIEKSKLLSILEAVRWIPSS